MPCVSNPLSTFHLIFLCVAHHAHSLLLYTAGFGVIKNTCVNCWTLVSFLFMYLSTLLVAVSDISPPPCCARTDGGEESIMWVYLARNLGRERSKNWNRLEKSPGIVYFVCLGRQAWQRKKELVAKAAATACLMDWRCGVYIHILKNLHKMRNTLVLSCSKIVMLICLHFC